MINRSALRAAVTTGLLGGVLAVSTVGATTADAATTGRPSVAIHVTKHHGVAAPNRIAPGAVRLRNTGKYAIVVFRKGRHGLTTFVHDADATHRDPQQLFKDFELRDVIVGHTDAYLRLGRGTYYLANGDAARPTAAQVHVLIVTGKTRNAKLPASKSFDLDRRGTQHAPRTMSTRDYLHLSNDSTTVQTLSIMEIGRHTSDAQLASFATKPDFDKFGSLDIRSLIFAGAMAPHHSAWMMPHLRPGRYLVMNVSISTTHFALHPSHLRIVTVHAS